MIESQTHQPASQQQAQRVARSLDRRLLARFRRLNLADEPLIGVGFSGGPDSLCLAASLARLQRPGRFRVHLIHVDHGLRDESTEDAKRARDLARALRLPITIHALEPGLAGRATGIGIEDAARRERYAALSVVGGHLDIDLLALGHHQRDQVETVLLHLLRGAGLTGAAAMSEVTESDLMPGTPIWRPMLSESRGVIEAAVDEAGLTPIHDPSNDDGRFLRNWIRAELLPEIEARVPGGGASLARFAEIAAEEDRLMAKLAESRLAPAVDSHCRLRWSLLADDLVAIKRRVVKSWLDRVLHGNEVSFDRVGAVLTLAERKNPEATIQLGGGAIAVWADGALIAGSQHDVRATLASNLNGPFASPSFQARGLQSGAPVEIDGWRLTGWGSGSVELRRVASGDRMAGSGRPIRELARAHGVHPLLRRQLIVAASEHGPVWVAGLPIAESGWRFELTRVEGNR